MTSTYNEVKKWFSVSENTNKRQKLRFHIIFAPTSKLGIKILILNCAKRPVVYGPAVYIRALSVYRSPG